MTGLWLISYFILWILFIILALVVVIILRNLGIVYQSLPNIKLPPSKLLTGDPLPELDLLTLSGEEMLLSKFQGIKTAFLLVSANCEPCKEFLSKIQTNGADPFDPSVKRKVLISISSIDDTLDMLQQIGINHNTFVILVDENKSAAENWGILSTPTTIIADEKLRVVSQIFGN